MRRTETLTEAQQQARLAVRWAELAVTLARASEKARRLGGVKLSKELTRLQRKAAERREECGARRARLAREEGFLQ
jgi:hypothetical protein